ncbi:type IV conjugative transfer system coupling protein TraD [Pectobacterium brasiliense]|uniref:type IV conjugative transfer system coupling protein TraD n=1 Tax=Pectobacterium brasiliense TaxID=180957 RepID=UPI001968FA2D|nr:type IV conjugative transfer system coupling protein TraD [Pectobacterium brasiliense]MBN3262942.1 type IV conjugative transfer system coupling protein TraD [Pectobacterium brasiliense]
MSFIGKDLTQGGQMTAYRWRMFIQVNNWIGYWVLILFIALGSAVFFLFIPQEVLDNGTWYWYAEINHSFSDLVPIGKGKVYDVHYFYEKTNTNLILKMTLQQMVSDPYMQAMGDDLLSHLKFAGIVSGTFSVFVFIAVGWYVARIGRKESEDEYLSGMKLTDSPSEVNKMLRHNGELSDIRVGDLRLVKNAEIMNFLIHGTIGVGKSTIIRWLLDYIRQRGDRAIIYDSGCTFTETHYNPRTDFILNPHDERCPNWDLWGECVDVVDYENMAASLIPVEGDSDPFWVSSSRTIWADLAIRMSADPNKSIEKFLLTLLSLSMKSLREYLANTPSANLVEEKIEKTAISIRSVVTNYAKALRYLQGLDDGKRPSFTIRDWMTNESYDNSWLFISTQARHRKSVRPLISLWMSQATLLLQSMGENYDRRVWFIIDETPSLQRIPEFNETLSEARKFGGCFVLGIQNMAQLVHVYGPQLAKSMLDLLNTRMYGRSPSAEMAKLVEEELGKQRRKEAKEQNSFGLDQVRDGISIGKDKVSQPIVDYEEIMKLSNLKFYVRLPGEYPVVKLALKYRKIKKRHPGLIERNIRDALSPELEKVIRENERTSALAGLTFPTGDEAMEAQNVSTATEAKQNDVEPSASSQKQPDLKQEHTQQSANGESVTNPVRTPTRKSNQNTKLQLLSDAVTIKPDIQATPSTTPPIEHVPENTLLTELQPRHEKAVIGDALALLRKRQQPVVASNTGDTNQDGGESMSLEMKVAQLPNGELQLQTSPNHRGKATGHDSERPEIQANQRMAQEEENILRHRHPDDPGYNDQDYITRDIEEEHER